jgi:N-acetylmuramoyl-L-alanine amidase
MQDYSTLSDVELFSLVTWREARGEGFIGMLAVAWVIWHRHIAWNKPLREVILGTNQFQSMTVDEYPTSPVQGDVQYIQAQDIVGRVMSGTIQDPTEGSLYYYNPKTANSPWFTKFIVGDPREHPQTVIIGHQTFYK